ncbi:MAG: sulfotransferase [Candidatus Aminicenantes bacterium]|nr:sulfotransferase [Candidatus Aminicenantes bacterium]
MSARWSGRFLSRLERWERARATDCGAAQLFLTGLPRTGTTLVSQYIVHRLDVAYFTNGVKRFPLAPCTVSRWQRWLHPPYQSDFLSEYGRSKGPMAPREAGAFWGHYFDLNRYQKISDVPPLHLEAVRRTVWRMQNIFSGAAFVNKNVKHLLRLNILATIFPKAYFLVIQRSLPDIAISVLIGRRQLSPDGSKWFSIVPRCYEEIRQLPVVEQIPRQLIDIQEKMEEDLARIAPARILYIPYGEFCQAPEALIDKIRNCCPGLREKSPAVASFPEKRHEPANSEQIKLVRVMQELIRTRLK